MAYVTNTTQKRSAMNLQTNAAADKIRRPTAWHENVSQTQGHRTRQKLKLTNAQVSNYHFISYLINFKSL